MFANTTPSLTQIGKDTMINISMKTKIFLTLIIVFSILIGALVVYLPSRSRETELRQQLTTENVHALSLQKQVGQLQETVSSQIVEQKQAALADYKDGLVYFSQKVTRLSANQLQVDIYLKGDPKTTADAVDLVMSYPQDIHIKEIRKGSSFASYPRLLDQNHVVTITGVAMPQGNTFVYGRVNELYATLIVEKEPGSAESISLDTKNTQAYLDGSPVLDFTQSFKKIDL